MQKKKKKKEMAAFKCNLKSYKHILWRKDKVAKRIHTETKKIDSNKDNNDHNIN